MALEPLAADGRRRWRGICRSRVDQPCWCGPSVGGAVEPACDVSTWSETGRDISPRAVLTERARKPLADMVNIDGDSIASSAVFFGVGWHAANQAVRALDNRHPALPSLWLRPRSPG